MANAIRYRLTVWATCPIFKINEFPGQDIINAQAESATKGVERHIMKMLRRSEYDCDVEYQGSELINEE